MEYDKVTEAMAEAGRQIASDLMDANFSRHMGGLGGSKTWSKWIEGVDIKNKDLAIAYANGEIDSVTAIYKAMRRVRS